MNIKKHFFVYKGLPRDMYILFVSSVINRMGSFIMPLMTLIVTQKIGFSKSEAGVFITISMASQAPFIMLGGKLIDKIGSKKTIVIFDMLGALIYFICGFLKPDYNVAVLLIIAADLYAIASPAFTSIVTEITGQSLMKNAYSLMYLGFNLGLTIGPVIGGLLFNSYLNLLFIFDAITTVAATFLILLFVKDRKNNDSAAHHDEEPEKIPSSIFSFLLRNPIIVIYSAVLMIYNFCYVQWGFLLPLQTVDIFRHNSSGFYSLLVSINAVTVIVLTPLITSMTHKLHPLKSIYIGGILYFCSFAMFAINRFALTFITAIIVMTIGEIFISINTNTYVAKFTPQAYIGRVNSLLFILNGIGYAMGPVVIGDVLTRYNFRSTWLIISGLMLCGAMAMYAVKRFDKTKTDD